MITVIGLVAVKLPAAVNRIPFDAVRFPPRPAPNVTPDTAALFSDVSGYAPCAALHAVSVAVKIVTVLDVSFRMKLPDPPIVAGMMSLTYRGFSVCPV